MNNELLHWNYFISLEEKLLEVSRFIEITEDNFGTYSVELTQLYLSASSEVDVVCKELCKKIDPEQSPDNIDKYMKILTRQYPYLPTMKMNFPRYGLTFTPWSSWSEEESPLWWKEHNHVKHNRAQNYNKSNLKNVLESMSGLFILILLFNRNLRQIEPPPIIFIPSRKVGNVAPVVGGPLAFFYNENSQ